MKDRPVRKRHIEGQTMELKACRRKSFSPPAVYVAVAVLGIADDGVREVADMASDLVVSPGRRLDQEQGATRITAPSHAVHDGTRFLEDAVVVVHRAVDDRRAVE